MIPPGATIGILGGGQLGRMLAMAAAQLGYRTHVYSPAAECIAAAVCSAHTRAAWDDAGAMARFAADCAVVTYEFENVPVGPLTALGQTPLRPGIRALEVARDRLMEKRFVESLGGMTAPYRPVASRDDLDAALTGIGMPGILKTRCDGYDGKGQWRIDDRLQAREIGCDAAPMIYERLVRFSAEFSVILARGEDRGMVYWDSAENVHHDGILARSIVPACPEVLAQVEAARRLAGKVAEALDYIGVAAFEFFASESGPVFNEMAPRVHNSGHWTIEGALTSQFENHIRAICGLPLGDTRLTARRAEMRNLVGDEVHDWAAILVDPRNHLHLYGKGTPRPGRKLGHVTRLDW